MRRMTRWQAEGQREDFADMFVEAYGGEPGEEFRGREDFLARLAEQVQQPEFDMVVAGRLSGTIGCAFGYPLDRDGAWWEGFVGELPQQVEELTASGQVFLVAEFMILPQHRDQEVATRLLDELLAPREEPFAVLATEAPGGAGADYPSLGWQLLGEIAPQPGGRPKQVFAVDLQAAVRSDQSDHIGLVG